MLAQRHVDRIRVQRRIDPLPEEDDDQRAASPAPPPDPDRPRLLAIIKRALAVVLSRLGTAISYD